MSSRLPLVAGNWKMNGCQQMVHELLSHLCRRAPASLQPRLAVFPPFVFLEQVKQQLQSTAIVWGGQDLCDRENGAFTGEVSATMLAEFGCRYVIIGHSERREHYGEGDELIARKHQMALAAQLVPILCVGETLAQREAGQTEAVIGAQIDAVLAAASGAEVQRTAVAYEPVWAIGTGQTATPEQAQRIHAFIRQRVGEHHGAERAAAVTILYGGSVKPDNAAALFAMADIDGALVGGASLDADDFLAIAEAL